MKFTPEVQAALETLYQNAENDFERHRLDVLVRDLTAPPTVEVINEHTQSFDGEIFHLVKTGHHHNSKAIHQRVWHYYFGEVPTGYEIHHRDKDKTNNDLSNLQLLTRGEHQRIHMTEDPEHRPVKIFVCVQCGKEYTAVHCGRNKFCSSMCRNKWRQAHELIKRICPQCGKEFETYKNNSAKCCSHACAMNFKRKHQPEIRICPTCGKSFTSLPYKNQKFCSCSCAAKGRNRKT